MVSCVYRKCQTRTGVSAYVNMTFECVTIIDSEFSNRVLVWTTPKSTSIKGITIWLEQLDFCLHMWKWELPYQHIAYCILPSGLFFQYLYHFDSLQSWHVLGITKLPDKAKFLISEPDSCWVPTVRSRRTSIHTVFVVLFTMCWGPAYALHTFKSVWRAVTVGATNTISSA